MLLHSLGRLVPAAAAAASWRLNTRLFLNTRGVEGTQQQEDSKERWKKKQIRKTKSIRKFIPKTEFDNGWKTGVSDGFKSYLENIILATIEEKKEVLLREKLLNSSLPNDLLELRGLALINLALDTSYKQVADGKEVQVRLIREGMKCLPAGGWRRGMLVTIELEGYQGFSNLEEWRKKNGVLVDVGSEWVVVSLDNLDSWVLETLTARRRLGGVRLVKRSEDGIYMRSLEQMKYLMTYPINFKETTPQGYIFRNILEIYELPSLDNSSCSDILGESQPKEHNLVICNKKLLTDSSKKNALTACSACAPLTVNHGPPCTGKTTTLAAAVLSAVVANAVAECWPGGRERRGKLVRLGNRLRLTTKEVEKFLPENVARSDRLLDIEQKIWVARSQLVEGGRERSYLVEEEARLVGEHKKVHKEIRVKIF